MYQTVLDLVAGLSWTYQQVAVNSKSCKDATANTCLD